VRSGITGKTAERNVMHFTKPGYAGYRKLRLVFRASSSRLNIITSLIGMIGMRSVTDVN